MKAARFVIVVVGAVIALGIFLGFSKPHDAIPGLRPYVSSETDRFTMQTRPGLPQMPIYEQTLVVHDLTSNKLREIFVKAAHKGSVGYSASIETPPDMFKMLAHPHGPMHVPVMTDEPVTKVVAWHGLSWNEILYARLTHFGKDPFK